MVVVVVVEMTMIMIMMAVINLHILEGKDGGDCGDCGDCDVCDNGAVGENDDDILWLRSISTSLKVRMFVTLMLLLLHLLLAMWKRGIVSLRRDKLCV